MILIFKSNVFHKFLFFFYISLMQLIRPNYSVQKSFRKRFHINMTFQISVWRNRWFTFFCGSRRRRSKKNNAIFINSSFYKLIIPGWMNDKNFKWIQISKMEFKVFQNMKILLFFLGGPIPASEFILDTFTSKNNMVL